MATHPARRELRSAPSAVWPAALRATVVRRRSARSDPLTRRTTSGCTIPLAPDRLRELLKGLLAEVVRGW